MRKYFAVAHLHRLFTKSHHEPAGLLGVLLLWKIEKRYRVVKNVRIFHSQLHFYLFRSSNTKICKFA